MRINYECLEKLTYFFSLSSYNIESVFRSQSTNRPSVEQIRDERVIKEIVEEAQERGKLIPDPLSKKTFVPNNIFGTNVSPGLSKPSE